MSNDPKILVVDDTPANLDVIRKVLRNSESELVMATNGNEALALALEHEFALALLDVRMPDMDGFELASLLQESEEAKDLPIIFVTGAADEAADAIKGFQIGAVDYIVKPIQPHILRSKVKVFLDLYLARRDLEKQNESLEGLVQKRTEDLRKAVSAAENALEVAEHARIQAEGARKEMEGALRRAEEANVAKARFLSKISHEILTPMNGIVGMLQLLDCSELKPSQLECLRVVNQSAAALLDIMGQMLEYAGAGDPRQRLQAVSFDIQGLIEEVDLFLRPMANEKCLNYLIKVAPQVPDHVIGDPERIRQILINLLSNAVKFTDNGSVSLKVEAEPAESHHVRLHFVVTDTGVGIASNRIESIFDSFVQGDDSSTRRHGGIGLGLPIALASARSMDGEITVTSEEGKGSEFTFSVTLPEGNRPVETAGHPDDESVTETGAGRKKIQVLLAEDNNINQIVASGMLKKMGCDVDLAENGEVAVEKARNKDYDLVLMDLDMPKMDGFDATRAIRKLGGHGATVPIIAVTANLESGTRSHCLDVGMNEYLPKPIKLSHLQGMMRALKVLAH